MAALKPSFQLQTQFSQKYLKNPKEMYENAFVHSRLAIVFILVRSILIHLSVNAYIFFCLARQYDVL